MLQAKFSCKEDQIAFLNSYRDYGFKNKSSMIREALNLLRKERDRQTLRQSADLYAETYDKDSELRELTATATHGWPE
jgi:Arc/MetJ-type ribon-helix-helix transcriptional regulator